MCTIVMFDKSTVYFASAANKFSSIPSMVCLRNFPCMAHVHYHLLGLSAGASRPIYSHWEPMDNLCPEVER
jgi:hypothetical protein